MGGGGKGGGGGHTPIEKPNTLESAQRLKVIDLLCEGVAGQDVTFKNIYLDNTPIQNADGTYNFTGIRVSALPGTHNQDYLAGFDSTDKIVAVGTEVKAATPITRTITDPLVDSVRVTLALGSLVTMKDNGDRVGGSVSLTVMCGGKSYPVTISGKTTSAYHQDVMLTDLPDVPFNISVQRNTPDSATDKTSNATHWVSYVESIDAKFSYPNSVVVGLEIDSAQFGGQIPKRTYRNKWTQIKVPSNYDPVTRTYEGVWLGEFKTAWSDNPAWVFYDLVTDKRYGLGDRLGEFGCDKWSLYQIAKYCDQIVPDGFGGQEPRFTCNAYLSEPRDAKALLDDLASVFRGIAVWDGQMVTALQDAKKDPTATYSNANVVDGMFAYSGAAQKTIFTAVHVKYNDKTDNYATKTEYVADDDAIKRYGLNVKQITAFGCTSRGQAARVGKWLIETSIRERQMVSFSVGREGIRHLPFDIIEIADNDYAGDMIGGRVLSVSGNTITVDRAMSAINSIRYYANGQSKVISVTAVQDNVITLLESPVGIEQLGVFSATKTDVKPRLFRALSIAEDDGTYTISAVQHDENKEAVVDQGVTFEQDSTATKHKPQVSYGRVSKDGDELVLSWEGTNTTQYLIKIYKDGELYNSYTQDTAEIKLKGLSNGEYRAEIRGKSVSGELTEAVIKEWSIDYDIKGLKATPELFAIKLDWTNPTTVINKAKIGIYRSQTADRATASKVATLSYPTDTFTQNGVKLTETHHFWLRLVDEQGNAGDWVTVSGQCSSDTSQIVESINGQITQTELAQSLIDSLQNDIDTAKDQAVGTAGIDAANKVAAEATARANAIQAEVTARQQAMAAQDTKQTNALIAKANELGTQITEVSGVNDQQAQQLTTITTKQGELTSGLEIERTARIAGDTAEAAARQTLVSQVNGNKTSITDLQSTKASKTEVSSLARTALQSEWKEYADDKVNNLEIGGRNLILNSDFKSPSTNGYGPVHGTLSVVDGLLKRVITAKASSSRFEKSFILNEIGTFTYTIMVKSPTSGRFSGLVGVIQVAETSHIAGTEFSLASVTFNNNTPGDKIIRYYTADAPVGEEQFIKWEKLERGNKATDWTPAPEDVDAAIDVVSSELTSFKETTASKDSAQTVVNNQALSRIGAAESSITSLQSTKASKTEVSSLARTALQSEWQDAATTAKSQAITAAAVDAKAKADAALASAKTDAQTKADAAKAAAQSYANAQVNAKSLSDKAYADGLVTAEEQRAINDANAKLAAAKTDAQTKADAAESAAKAHADAEIDAIEIGGRNLLLNSNSYVDASVSEVISDAKFRSVGYQWDYRFDISLLAETYTTSVLVYNPHDTESVARVASGALSSDTVVPAKTLVRIEATSTVAAWSGQIYFLTNAGDPALLFSYAKLERGNKATDWTPAPEDVDAAIDVVSSELTEFKETTASKDSAQTVVNNQALSRINSNESRITSLQSTKASKTEVSSLARTALQSEWQSAANTAKSQAISAAAIDAQAKADAIEIGGRNLLLNSNSYVDASVSEVISDAKFRSVGYQWDYRFDISLLAETYTTSVLVYNPHDTESVARVASGALSSDTVVPAKTLVRIEATSTVAAWSGQIYFLTNAGDPALLFSYAKLERGNKATDWTKAPEDVAADIDVVSSELTSFKETTASKDSAQTIVNNQALSRINTAEGKITTLQSTSVTKDKAQSTHTIKTQAIAGGKRAIAGIAIGAMANEITSESQVIVMADKFGVVRDASDGVVKPMLTVVNNQVAVNGDLIADGTILGQHIKANQTITAPVINGGSLNINNQFKVDKFGNLTAKSGTFEGTVLADKINGFIGIESMKRSAWLPSWDVYSHWSPQVDTPDKLSREYPASHASRGAITYIWGGQGIYALAVLLFEIRVYCTAAITVTQKVHARSGTIRLYINELLINDNVSNTVQLELNEGFNLIQYFVRTTGYDGVGALIGGNFIDNDKVKFA